MPYKMRSMHSVRAFRAKVDKEEAVVGEEDVMVGAVEAEEAVGAKAVADQEDGVKDNRLNVMNVVRLVTMPEIVLTEIQVLPVLPQLLQEINHPP